MIRSGIPYCWVLMMCCIAMFCSPVKAQTPWRFVLPDSYMYQMNFSKTDLPKFVKLKKSKTRARVFKTVAVNGDTFVHFGGYDMPSIFDTLHDLRIVNFSETKLSQRFRIDYALPFFGKDCNSNLLLNCINTSNVKVRTVLDKSLLQKSTVSSGIVHPSSYYIEIADIVSRIKINFNSSDYTIFTFKGVENIYRFSDSSYYFSKDTVVDFGYDYWQFGNSYLSHDGRLLLRTGVAGMAKYGKIGNDEIVSCDFDTKTGKLSNRKTWLKSSQVNPHFTSSFAGFSSNDSFIWVAMTFHSRWISDGSIPYPASYPLLWQINRYTGAIYKHFYKPFVKPAKRQMNVVCTLEQGPDGRFYFLWLDGGKGNGRFHVGCITNPNQWGAAVQIVDSVLSVPNVKFPYFRYEVAIDNGLPSSLGESDEPVWWFEGEQTNYGACTDSAIFSIGVDTSLYVRLVFGDGDSIDLGYCSKNRNYIKHKYKHGGKYQATLRILSKDCYARWQSVGIPVAVYPPLQHSPPSWQGISSCSDYTLSVHDSIAVPLLLHVNWGNGKDTAFKHQGKLQLMQHFTTTDTLAVRYFVSDTNQCAAEYKDTFYAQLHPPVLDTAWLLQNSLCAGESVKIASRGQSADSIHVQYGISKLSAATHDTILLTAIYGQDSLLVRYTNAYGCFYDTVLRLQLRASPHAVLSGADTICAMSGTPLVLSTVQYTDSVLWWLQGKAQSIHADTIFHVFADTGIQNYSVLLTNTQGCSTVLSGNVMVQSKPSLRISKLQEKHCSGKVYTFEALSQTASTYQWYRGAEQIGAAQKLQYTFADSGKVTLVCHATAATGCMTTDTIQLYIQQGADATFAISDTALCAGNAWQAASKAQDGISTWQWNGMEENNTTLMLTAAATKTLEGHYPVVHIHTAANTCSDTAVQSVRFYRLPVQTINYNNPLCTNDTVAFTQISTDSITWQIEGEIYTGPWVQHVFDTAGEKVLKTTATTENGCTDSISTKIMVHATPQVRMKASGTQYDPNMGYGYYFKADPDTLASYRWYLNAIEQSRQSTWNTYFPVCEQLQSIRLTAVSSAGCSAQLDTQLYVYGMTQYLFPTAITANMDGKNEGFVIAGPEYVKSYKLWIFNRWGEAVFYTEKPEELWIPGNAMPGQYVYKAKVQDIYSRWQEVQGVFMVLK